MFYPAAEPPRGLDVQNPSPIDICQINSRNDKNEHILLRKVKSSEFSEAKKWTNLAAFRKVVSVPQSQAGGGREVGWVSASFSEALAASATPGDSS